MICQDCRDDRHCGETSRPGAWCDCGHEPREVKPGETGTAPVHAAAD